MVKHMKWVQQRMLATSFQSLKNQEDTMRPVFPGYFFTPAEFVEHAGGKNVTDPLKHIKVSRDGWCC